MYLRNKKMEDKEKRQIDIKVIWQALLKHKRLFIKVIAATFVIACFLTLSVPNYYSATVALAPELSSGRSSSSSSLSSLASSFGVSLGSVTNSADAINPTLYPDMMKSVNFKTSLFPIKVRKDNKEEMTYYDYLLDHQKFPWWNYVLGLKNVLIGSIISLFTEPMEIDNSIVNPFMLTREQARIIKRISEKISCDVDSKNMVINISVTDQDPLVAAVIADSVKQRLQDAVTEYRTSKARVDLEYNKKLYAETKARYDEARQKYAAYADANQNVILQRDRNKLIELENEMQIRYQAYSTVAAQLQAAEAKVQQDTPAFTTLRNATVPLEKSGPHRARIVILLCFFIFFCTCAYVLHKEGYFVPLFLLFFGLKSEKAKSHLE
jgi:uncharacterized protein involved in exopolysaccharide biosynthesis